MAGTETKDAATTKMVLELNGKKYPVSELDLGARERIQDYSGIPMGQWEDHQDNVYLIVGQLYELMKQTEPDLDIEVVKAIKPSEIVDAYGELAAAMEGSEGKKTQTK